MFEMDGAVSSRREQFHVSSIDWHRFLAIQSAMEVVASQKRKGDAADVGQREGWARLQQMKMRRQFRRMIELEAVGWAPYANKDYGWNQGNAYLYYDDADLILIV
jgi:hypothetical protein